MTTETTVKLLQSFIDEKIAEGKSAKEIATAIISEKVVPDFSGTEVVDAVNTYMKMLEAQAAMDSLKAKSEQKEERKAEVEEAVKEKLLSIQVNPLGKKYDIQRELKRFNQSTGKSEVVDMTVSEAYGTFNNMIKAIGTKDERSTKAISAEIEQDNQAKYLLLDGQKATPSVSDVSARGAYSIPTEVNDTIMQIFYEQSELYSKVNKQIVRYLSKVFPVMYGMDVSYIVDQSTGVTEKNPAFSNPTVNMYRVGGYATISNLFLEEKGYDLTGAFINAFASEFASFFDLHCVAGNVTYNSDKVDGIIFDPNTNLPSAIAAAALSRSTLTGMKNTLSSKVSLKNCAWVANRAVADIIGFLEDTGGRPYFPGYIEGKMPSPLGIPLIVNPQIPSTLDVGADRRTTGTDDALVLADLSKVVVGISQETRIDTSEHAFFTDDLFAIRAIKMFGQKVLSSTSTAGIVAVAQELTN